MAERSTAGATGTVMGAAVLLVALVDSLLDRNGGPGQREEPRARPPGRQEPAARGIRGRLSRLPVVGAVLRVQARYSELGCNNLASAVAFQVFVSLFPLMLLIVGVLGIVAHSGNVDVAGKIVGNLGLTGESARAIGNAVHTAENNRRATAPLGLLGLLWSGLGLVNAFQFAFDQVWQVEERGMKDKAVGILWLGGATVLFVATAAVTSILEWLPGFAVPLSLAVALGVNLALWLWTFKVLPNRKLPWRALLPGAVVGAVGMEVLKVIGAVYVPRLVANSSQLYGSLGVVFAVLAWLLIFSRLVLYATVVNVVRWERQVGTVRTTIEVPGGSEVQASDDVTRSGRIEKDDIRS